MEVNSIKSLKQNNMTEPKIDFEKIYGNHIGINSEHQYKHTAKEDVIAAMREATKEAIRLAAPLFAQEAETKVTRHKNDISGMFDYEIVDKQSIIDAVEKVTNQIIGKC